VEEKNLVNYDIADAVIAEMGKDYMTLKIDGIDDKEGFAVVHDARMVVKGKRIQVEKKRKELKSDALAWGKKVDGEAKRIFSLLEPIESHLQAEEDKVRAELDAIKAEEEAKEKAKVQAMVDELLKYGLSMEFFTVATMTDEDYDALLVSTKAAWEAEQSRLAAEERAKEEAEEAALIAREKEDERLAEVAKQQKAEAERQELVRKEQAATEAKLKAAQDKIDAENRERVRQQELEVAKSQAAKKAAKEERERIEREAKEAKEKAEREAREKAEAEARAAEEAARQEALRPDKAKLEDFADMLLNITRPPLSEPKAQRLGDKAVLDVYDVAEHVRAETRGL